MRKKKWFVLCLCVFIVFVSFYFWEKRDDGEFVRWGDSIHSVNTAVLKRNDIKYKIENDKVYIPKKSFDKAIWCCS
ncbi:hypothetical protein [Bacillus wiedmannii]|uniref:hypothetical protein n=1 Tax=Bacillus wiedmannii TaxID=1890302 RepID=UPI000BF61D50|nr:hypothetical protein [Bacillus wiedmannii]PFY95519.1 hypothetical protein COL57_21755 [Bacillus wiedmannii]PGB81105.1 hypothetical protein COM03_10060 [Bacillus wiedmannii]PGD93017.1 hypothetical protein COM48_18355 [Bacillus wiedmannii]PHG72926.1 hypothetical protein COI50_28175 [Bacillus wiedmannii]PTC15456.1 hypothetical protein C6557_02420 [Bacillus wiedmannii]